MSRTAEQLFDDWARRGRDQGMAIGHLPRAVGLLERMRRVPGTRLLDLGCGNGWATRWIAGPDRDTGPMAVGIDASADMLAKAAAFDGPRTRYARARFEALPFQDGSFAEVFSMEALYYATDLDAALAEIRRVLGQRGRLYLALDYYLENVYSHCWSVELGVPMTLLGEAEWQARLERAGFVVDDRCRCLDPRPAPADASDRQRREIEDFRANIGSLALIATPSSAPRAGGPAPDQSPQRP